MGQKLQKLFPGRKYPRNSSKSGSMTIQSALQAISSGFYITSLGEVIPLDGLTPQERRFWLRMLKSVEPRTIEACGNDGAQDDPGDERIRAGWDAATLRAFLHGEVERSFKREERARQGVGPLPPLLEDLERRITLRRGGDPAVLFHDPRTFLTDVYEDAGSLSGFCEQTGLKTPQASKVLAAIRRDIAGGEGNVEISIEALRQAAVKSRRAFRSVQSPGFLADGDSQPPDSPITLRDLQQQTLGQKVLAVCSRLRRRKPQLWAELARECFSTEFRARAAADSSALTAALRLGGLYTEQVIAAAEAPSVLIFDLTEALRQGSVGSVSWLLLAIEFRWMEEQGATPLICTDESLAGRLSEALGAPVVRLAESSGRAGSLANEARGGDWFLEDLELVHRVIYDRSEVVQPKQIDVSDSAERAKLLANCFRWASRLLSHSELAPITRPVIGAWAVAMGLTPPAEPWDAEGSILWPSEQPLKEDLKSEARESEFNVFGTAELTIAGWARNFNPVGEKDNSPSAKATA